MYKDFFGLRVEPFNVTPDPRFLFLTDDAREALASLSYGIHQRKGFCLLTGEVGTGKTTILHKLLEWLQRMHYASAFIVNPRLSVADFFDVLMADFGIDCEAREKGQRLLHLNRWLLERHRAGETAVLIVDEAQDLSTELLEELRLLTNVETFTQKLLQVVLCGQPELNYRLKDPQLRQLRQRIVVRCTTRALGQDESIAYVHERLRRAGANGTPIFTQESIRTIWQYSGGIPRIINLLCEHALISAFVDQEKPISAATIETIANEFELSGAQPVGTEVGTAATPDRL